MSTRAAPRALQHLGKGHRATIAPLVLAGLLLVGLLGYWLDFQVLPLVSLDLGARAGPPVAVARPAPLRE